MYRALQARMPESGTREERMQRAVDALWDALHTTGISWIGFYLAVPGKEEMLLGPRRDKPACSPIGLHGACGRSLLSGRALVVTDVATLGEGYIACDPRDRSEVVLPLLSPDGTAWGVLDADSYQVGAFTRDDAASLSTLVRCAGLCAGSGPLPVDTV
jgi:putative methionine-R-sulfoxide reductase with GAF domain